MATASEPPLERLRSRSRSGCSRCSGSGSRSRNSGAAVRPAVSNARALVRLPDETLRPTTPVGAHHAVAEAVSSVCPRCGYAFGADAISDSSGRVVAREVSAEVSRELSDPEPRRETSAWTEATRLLEVPSRMLLNFFENYRVVYIVYLLVLILVGACTILFVDNGVDSWVSAFYLSVSAVTMTGLSPVDFPAMGLATHVVSWILIILGSPMLLSVVPVLLRLRSSRRGGAPSPLHRLGGAAFFGLPTTASDEHAALKIIFRTVISYYIGCQLIGWLLLFLALRGSFAEGQLASCQGWLGCAGGDAWAAVFLATSAFHNAGLVSLAAGLPFKDGLASFSLSVVMVLILLGNTCFPIALRMLLALRLRLSTSRGQRRVLRLLLRYPRTCYTHLFPSYATRWLGMFTPLLVIVQILALCIVDFWAEPANGVGETAIMEGLAWPQRVLATLFQGVSTRTAGFSVLNLELLSPTSAFILCICMWVSVSPVIVVMRSTQRTADDPDLPRSHTNVEKTSRRAREQFSKFMRENSSALMGLFFLILLGQEFYRSEKNVREKSFLFIVFEFCSAYGTVGLSMSSKPWSQSGDWCPPSQLCLMVVMVLGRLRGLPEAIDPSVRFQEVAIEEDETVNYCALEAESPSESGDDILEGNFAADESSSERDEGDEPLGAGDTGSSGVNRAASNASCFDA